ncbi:hypothetical protein, partial [Pseudomonas sp.]|uniref:hypothetical protein n=1 Tax=Pseudomonas sp. TaxID=306 RepID=UPI0028B0BBAA
MAVPLAVEVKPVAQSSFTETVLLLELQDYSLSDRKQAFLMAVFCLNIQRAVRRTAFPDAATRPCLEPRRHSLEGETPGKPPLPIAWSPVHAP